MTDTPILTALTGRPANDEMIAGYFDGRRADTPEPSGNRSASYRHGFLAGRNDLRGKSDFTAAEMIAKADAAMAEDEGINAPSTGAECNGS